MRTLHSHEVNPVNQELTIEVLDEPGSGSANHLYMISGFDTTTNPSDPFVARHGDAARHSTILFQNGPIPEFGVNGLTHEALLAILIDRLESFQRGPYACDDNAEALGCLNNALRVLKRRTERRIARGVEGTHKV